MASTHDYDTRTVKAGDLDETMTLVGECGGLSSILGRDDDASPTRGYFDIVTEHGRIHMYETDEVEVLA